MRLFKFAHRPHFPNRKPTLSDQQKTRGYIETKLQDTIALDGYSLEAKRAARQLLKALRSGQNGAVKAEVIELRQVIQDNPRVRLKEWKEQQL